MTSPDEEAQRSPSQSWAAPDGGYGWVVTTCVAVINGHSWGISAAYSVFLAHYLRSGTYPGATPLMYAMIGSLSIGVTLLMSPLVVIMARKLGTRPTMLIGAALQSASLVCASLSTQIWHLFLSQGVLFGTGMGLLFLPSYGIVSQWFTTRRALANGIAIAGAGLGGCTCSLMIAWMISNDLTDAATHQLMLPVANDNSTGYRARSRGLSETAHPRAQMTENRVKDAE